MTKLCVCAYKQLHMLDLEIDEYKQAMARPQDLAALRQLRAIKDRPKLL
jgi:hypothetical protein